MTSLDLLHKFLYFLHVPPVMACLNLLELARNLDLPSLPISQFQRLLSYAYLLGDLVGERFFRNTWLQLISELDFLFLFVELVPDLPAHDVAITHELLSECEIVSAKKSVALDLFGDVFEDGGCECHPIVSGCAPAQLVYDH